MTQLAYLDQLAGATVAIEQHEATRRALRQARREARRHARKLEAATRDGLPGLTRSEARSLRGIGTSLDLPVGTTLALQDAPGREAFLLLQGRLEVRRDGEAVVELTPGQLAGETAILTRALRNADVVALTPVRVLVFTPSELREALDRVPALAAQAASRPGAAA